MEVIVILTCFNRKNKTINCIKTLVEGNTNIKFSFIVVDDRSSDGTKEALESLPYNINLIEGSGSLFWCGGMRTGIKEYIKNYDVKYCLLVNDDVDFYENAIEKMLEILGDSIDSVIVGSTCDKKGNFTYGLRIHRSKWRIYLNGIEPSSKVTKGETFNANCVLMNQNIIKEVGNMDKMYTHSFGDYDFGFYLYRKGYNLISSKEYVGVCEVNKIEGTWLDRNLGRISRVKKKESSKGLPAREWFYYLRKNYNFLYACFYSIIPYIKILIGK